MLKDWRWFACLAAYLACVYLFGTYLLVERPTRLPASDAATVSRHNTGD